MAANLCVGELMYHGDSQGSNNKTLRNIEKYYVLNVNYVVWFFFIVLKEIM